MRQNGILTAEEQAIMRSELGKLIRIAKIARQDAIYDKSAAEKPSPSGKMIDLQAAVEEWPGNEDKEDPQKEGKNDFWAHARFPKKFTSTTDECEKVGILEKIKKTGPLKTHFTAGVLFPRKCHPEIKGRNVK